MKNCQYKLSIFFLFIFISLIFPYPAHALEKVEITTIDNAVTAYASFGSYNQKIIQNNAGIFLTYKKTNDSSDVGIWRIMRSTDGGKSFSIIFEATHNTKPPLVEAASSGNVYIATGGDPVYLYRLIPQNNYSAPELLGTIPNSASGKMSMIFDEKRQQLYFFSHSAYFSILDVEGRLIKGYQLGASGLSAGPQYPLLTIDENGILYAAWTTQKLDQYMYWDIHFILSKDGGMTWQKLDGTPIALPVVLDQTGPTDRVTLDDEFDVHTWLKSLLAKNGKIYFPYNAQFTQLKAHFVRYDLATAKKDLDVSPNWQGETIKLVELHGFCATKLKEPIYPLYCASRTDKGKIGVIVSYDQGATWHDYAEGNAPEDTNPWSVSGAREITSDGYLIGTYTNQVGSTADNTSAVRFFRVKVTDTAPLDPTLVSYWPMDETSGAIVNDRIGSHNGTTTASIVDGKFGKARSFVSKVWNTNTKIQFPSFSADFDTGTGFTVEAWIKKDSSTAGYEHRVIGNRYSWNDPNGWNLTFNSNEKITFTVQSTSAPSINLSSTNVLSTGTWYHIVGVYDNGTLKLYINGELNNTVSGAGYTPSNRELTISGQPDSPNYGFDGLIDEVRIYSFALSAEAIQQHFLGLNRADLNSDGKVNLFDYFYLVSALNHGQIPQSVNPDLNGDGLVNSEDRIIIINALKEEN